MLQTVDGKPADTYPRLKAILTAERQGRRCGVTFVRNTSPTAGTTTRGDGQARRAAEGRAGSLMGITVPPTPQCLAPYEVNLGLNDEIGGPSAGMMFALGIIDKVSEDLTKGRFIAGTGTISPNGAVGPIGGIQLKMIAARARARRCSSPRRAIAPMSTGAHPVRSAGRQGLHVARRDRCPARECERTARPQLLSRGAASGNDVA